LSDEEYVLLGIAFNCKWCKKSEGSYLIGYRYALAGIAQARKRKGITFIFIGSPKCDQSQKHLFTTI
jgi:hypothetical protein